MAGEPGSGPGKHRPVAHAEQPDPGTLAAPVGRGRHLRGHAHEGIVAVPAGDLFEGPARVRGRGRKLDAEQNLLGLEGRSPADTGTALLPVPFSSRLQVMSIGFLLGNRDDAVIWRGPLKMKVIQQFLSDVEWGDLDYLVVDCPPGTGDEPLSVVQLIEGADGALVVTTPQRLALSDVRKCIRFCQRLDLPVLGVIENMSGMLCPHCGKQVAVFSQGGGERMAVEMGLPFLGRIALDPGIVQASDEGKPAFSSGAPQPVRDAIDGIVQELWGRIAAGP